MASRSVTLGCFYALVTVTFGCVGTFRAADLMPESGLYDWGVPGTPSRRIRVVRSGTTAVLTQLPTASPRSMKCVRVDEPNACAEVVHGRDHATVLQVRELGIYEAETESGIYAVESDQPVVPSQIREGEFRKGPRYGDECETVHSITNVGFNSITIVTVHRCPHRKDQLLMTELWRRGVGRESLSMPSGETFVFRRIGP